MHFRITKKIGFSLFLGIHILLFLYFFITDTYPLFFIAIHGLCLLAIAAWIVKPFLNFPFLKKHWKDFVIMIVLFVAAIAIRIYKVEQITPGMWGDEVGYGVLGEQLLNSGKFTPFSNDLYAPPTPFLYLVGISVHLFGHTMTSIRLPAILFGALGVVAAYLFLRNLYSRYFAFLGSAILLVLYHDIIISRLAYVMPALVFFEFLALLFCYRAYIQKTTNAFCAAVFFIALGLYTYAAFQTIAVVLLGILFLVVLTKKVSFKQKIQSLGIVVCIFFICTVPFFSFSFRHPQHVFARVSAVSVFNQHFSTSDVLREIEESSKLTLGMFFVTGDPNARHNPAKANMYDRIFVGIGILGLLYLLIKKRSLALSGLLLTIPALANDIFSMEIIPGMDFYGIGHPNTLRVSALIPIMTFFFATGLYATTTLPWFSSKKIKKVVYSLLALVVLIAGIWNWHIYFDQKPDKFIYYANEVAKLDVVTFINRVPLINLNTVALTKKLADDQRVKYFSNPDIKLIPLDIKPTDTSLDLIPVRTYTLLDIVSAKNLALMLVDPKFQAEHNIDVRYIPNPFNAFDTLIVYRKE